MHKSPDRKGTKILRITLGLIFALIFIGLVSCQDKEPERAVVFSDYEIHINETGTGQPTVVIEAALGSGLDSYDTLQTAISELTRVLSYDRPARVDIPFSSPNPNLLLMQSKSLLI